MIEGVPVIPSSLKQEQALLHMEAAKQLDLSQNDGLLIRY
jgi:hypothetical protein